MSEIILDKENIEYLVLGGTILGGGGGGSIEKGREVANLALKLGDPKISNIDEFNDADKIITVSSVGAPAAKNQYVNYKDYVEVVEDLQNYVPYNIDAIITNENGGSATVNGLLQSVLLDIPLLDAPCNGRAHPTGVMGSMGLTELENYKSIQASIGGEPSTKYRIKQLVEGDISTTSKLIRTSADFAGGLVAVARNPIDCNYVKENAAVGALSQALSVGRLHSKGNSPREKIENVVKHFNGEIICEGKVNNFNIETKEGFDLGALQVSDNHKNYELTFWNEYMTCEVNNERLTTFPDLIMTFDKDSGIPITTSEIQNNNNVIVISLPYEKLILGKGMFKEENYKVIESTLDIEINRYIKDIFKS